VAAEHPGPKERHQAGAEAGVAEQLHRAEEAAERVAAELLMAVEEAALAGEQMALTRAPAHR
jgi:hypothetical protein